MLLHPHTILLFESLVNLEGCKTVTIGGVPLHGFESLVNLEGCKTHAGFCWSRCRLRVLLI